MHQSQTNQIGVVLFFLQRTGNEIDIARQTEVLQTDRIGKFYIFYEILQNISLLHC